MTDNFSGNFLRKHEQKKSGKALTIPLKGKVVSETPSTVKTAAGAVYRKSDIARSKLPVQPRIEGSEKKRSPTGEEPRSKQQETVTQDEDGDSESAEEHDVKDQGPRDQEIEDSWLVDKFQNSLSIVTSKDTKTGGGINLGGKKISQIERDRSYITREAIRASPQRKNRGNQKLPKQQQKNLKSGIQAMKKSTLSRLLLRKHQ